MRAAACTSRIKRGREDEEALPLLRPVGPRPPPPPPGRSAPRGPLPAAEDNSPETRRGPVQQTSHDSRSPRSSVTSTSGAFLLQPPSTNRGKKKIPLGGRSSLSEKRAGKGREKSARRPLDWHAVLCESPPRVPNGPRGKERSGTPLTSENPRHGRSRLRGAPDGARTGVCGRVTESCRPRRGPGAQACEAEAAAPPGVGGEWEFFNPLF